MSSILTEGIMFEDNEAALRNAVQDGLTLENAMKFLEDILDNLEYLSD